MADEAGTEVTRASRIATAVERSDHRDRPEDQRRIDPYGPGHLLQRRRSPGNWAAVPAGAVVMAFVSAADGPVRGLVAAITVGLVVVCAGQMLALDRNQTGGLELAAVNVGAGLGALTLAADHYADRLASPTVVQLAPSILAWFAVINVLVATTSMPHRDAEVRWIVRLTSIGAVVVGGAAVLGRFPIDRAMILIFAAPIAGLLFALGVRLRLLRRSFPRPVVAVVAGAVAVVVVLTSAEWTMETSSLRNGLVVSAAIAMILVWTLQSMRRLQFLLVPTMLLVSATAIAASVVGAGVFALVALGAASLVNLIAQVFEQPSGPTDEPTPIAPVSDVSPSTDGPTTPLIDKPTTSTPMDIWEALGLQRPQPTTGRELAPRRIRTTRHNNPNSPDRAGTTKLDNKLRRDQ